MADVNIGKIKYEGRELGHWELISPSEGDFTTQN